MHSPMPLIVSSASVSHRSSFFFTSRFYTQCLNKIEKIKKICRPHIRDTINGTKPTKEECLLKKNSFMLISDNNSNPVLWKLFYLSDEQDFTEIDIKKIPDLQKTLNQPLLESNIKKISCLLAYYHIKTFSNGQLDYLGRFFEEGYIGANYILGAGEAARAWNEKVPAHSSSASLPSEQQNADQEMTIEQEINAGSTLIGIFIGLIWFKFFRNANAAIKKTANMWYRCFKTMGVLGYDIGVVAANLISPAFMHPAFIKIFQICLGGLFGIVFALIGGLFKIAAGKFLEEKLKKIDNYLSGKFKFYQYLCEKNIELARFEKEGWSKYLKLGLVAGSVIGAALCVIFPPAIFFFAGSAIVFGAAVGGISGLACLLMAVPAFNYLKAFFSQDYQDWKNAIKAKNAVVNAQINATAGGTLTSCLSNSNVQIHPVTAKHSISKNTDSQTTEKEQIKPLIYRTNYARMGLSLGLCIGLLSGPLAVMHGPLIIGALLLAATPAGAIVLIGGICAIILAVAFHFIGPRISQWIDPQDSLQSSVDYDVRSATFVGQYGLGNLIGGALMLHNESQQTDVKDAALGGSGLLIGVAVGIGLILYYHFRQKNPSPAEIKQAYQDILPRSQSLASAAIAGMAIGSLIGFFFPPFGVFIGAGIGAIVFGAASLKLSEPFCEWMLGLKKSVVSTLISSELAGADIKSENALNLNPNPKLPDSYPKIIAQTEKDDSNYPLNLADADIKSENALNNPNPKSPIAQTEKKHANYLPNSYTNPSDICVFDENLRSFLSSQDQTQDFSDFSVNAVKQKSANLPA